MTPKMPIPAGFKYREVFLKGRPHHDRLDSFYGKHPPMPPSRWAKIYSPFDALKGFREEIGKVETSQEQGHRPEHKPLFLP